MIVLLVIVGHLIAGLITANLGRNVAINISYQRELNRLLGGDEYRHSQEKEKEHLDLEYAKIALREAKRSVSSTDMPFILIGCLTMWPLYLCGLGVYGLSKAPLKVRFLQSKSEKQVSSIEMQTQKKKQEKIEWQNAVDMLESAGIDTTEFKKLKNE
jgi:hypothetical protein